MKTMTIDIESRSNRDITKCGAYAYSDSPYFEITLFSVSIDGGEVQQYNLLSGDVIPEDILYALTDETIIKQAFNCNFERVCLSHYLRKYYPQIFHSYSIREDTVGDYLCPAGWHCTMIHCRTLGLPSTLADAGAALNLTQQKMTEGKALIRYFCVPYDTIEGAPLFHAPSDAPAKWEIFKAYNKQDVIAEMAIDSRLSRYPVPDSIWEEFYLDQEINDRGILIDTELADSAITLDAQAKAKLSAEMSRLTGIDNPNSVYQLLDWLSQQGYASDSLGKKQVTELLKTAKEPVRSVLQLRQQLSKSSVKKYTAMKTAICSDSRARGMFSYYGASRTGRQSSKLIQIQNLPQNHISDLAVARETVKYGSFDEVEMLYDDVPDTLSQLIRTAFIPRPGYKFVVADFNAIEARTIAWLAGEQWVLDTFAAGGDIYCETASRMFHCKVEKNGVNGELRQKGKQATLSCSYGGSTGALKAMGALESGMREDELKPLVDAWRKANPHIVQFWKDVETAAIDAVSRKVVRETHGMIFNYEAGMLFVTLPSGRRLAYVQPKIGLSRFGSQCITYMGLGLTKKWERLETFGGKIAENCIQAIARDLLFYAMQTLSHCFIVATVHDEMIIEADRRMSVEEVCEQMSRTPPWAKGLLLRADGYECEFYKKS